MMISAADSGRKISFGILEDAPSNDRSVLGVRRGAIGLEVQPRSPAIREKRGLGFSAGHAPVRPDNLDSLPPKSKEELISEAIKAREIEASKFISACISKGYGGRTLKLSQFNPEAAKKCVDKIFNEPDISVRDKPIVAKAALEAAWRLDLMRSKLDLVKSVSKPDSAVNHNYKYVSFPGGGAKGLAFPAVLEVYADQIKSADTLIGASAGALCAALVASGMDADEVERALRENQPASFLGAKPKNGGLFPNFKPVAPYRGQSLAAKFADSQLKISQQVAGPSGARVPLFDDGYSMLTRVNKLCLESIRKKLEGLANGTSHSDLVKRLLTDKNYVVNFSDMRQLHKDFPDKFKDIILVGTDLARDKQVFLSADTSPDMSIAEACRISAAVNPVFKSVEYNGVILNDGGFTNNNPIPPNASFVGETLVFTFDNNGESGDCISSNKPRFKHPLVQKIQNQVTQVDSVKGIGASCGNLWMHGPHVRVIKHNGLDTFDFFAPKATQLLARFEAMIHATNERISNIMGSSI